MTVEGVMPDENLDRLAEMIEPIENPRFIKIGETSWVYPEALSISERFREDENKMEFLDSVIGQYGAVARLNFPDHLLLQERIKEKFGIDLRDGSSEENLRAFNLKEAESYKEGVLYRNAVFTGELQKSGESVIRIKGIKIGRAKVPVEATQIIIDERGIEIPSITTMRGIEQLQYIADKNLGKKLPTKNKATLGNFEVIPTDEDLNPDGKIYWNGSSFSQDNYTAVVCGPAFFSGKPPERKLEFASIPPLHRYNLVTIPIWTDNPKK